MASKLEKLVAIPLALTLATGLGFEVNRAYAQDVKAQEQAKQEQKIYSTRDESKRDFAAHGEIDYTKIDLFASGRVCPTPPFAPPDYDHYTGKIIFAAHIRDKEIKQMSDGRIEIFLAEAKKIKSDEGIDLIVIDTNTQKRLTYDSSDNFGNFSPFWTADRNIVYNHTRYDVVKPRYFMIDQEGNTIKEIKSERGCERLFYKSHDKNRNIKIPPQE